MSGPYFILTDTGCVNGSLINYSLPINGFGGSAALFVEAFLDEQMFEILIGGRLNVKEKVCAERRVGYDKAKAASKYPAVRSKVRP
jgi:hypothetical protein